MMNKNFATINGKEVDVTTVFDKTVTYEPTEEMCDGIISEATDLLNEYLVDSLHEQVGLYRMFDNTNGVFWREKGWLINAMSKHPLYNGNLQIVIRDQDMTRHLNKADIYDFKNYVYDFFEMKKYYLDSQGNRYSYEERNELRSELFRQRDELHAKLSDNKITSDEFYAEYNRIDRDLSYLRHGQHETINRFVFRMIFALCDQVTDTGEWLVNDYTANLVNERAKDDGIKIRTSAGQKITRLVGKIAKLTDIVKHTNIQDLSFYTQDGDFVSRTKDIGWNYQYARFCDATSPITIKGTAVISVNPIDFYTMSFGTNWSSCMTIDKDNKRRMDNSYHGMYCGGTESYMLDNSTFLFYYLSNDFVGDKPELEAKIKRCLFMIGEDKLVQSRVYPDGRDGGDGCESLPGDVRALVQRIVSEMFDVPNYWDNKKGSSACCDVICSRGVHYRDYACYEDPNVSYLKRIDGYKNVKCIEVGSNPICPECGKIHSYEENVFCPSCERGKYICERCGCRVSEDDVLWIDGEAYCSACVEECDICGAYIVRGYGTETNDNYCVCDYCLDNRYVWSEYDAEYVRDHDSVCTEEGDYFHECSDGYRECDNCGALHNIDNMTMHNDEWYCETCYEAICEDIDVDEDDE